VVDKFPIL